MWKNCCDYKHLEGMCCEAAVELMAVYPDHEYVYM